MTLDKSSRGRITRPQTHKLLLVSACGSLLWFPGCAEGRAGQTAGGENARSEANATSPLTREIRHQLTVLPFYSVFDSITFTLDGKKVTLTGQVLRATLKRNAAEAVQSLEGVDTVVDQIEVLPNSASDDELRRGVYRAIFETAELAPYAAQTAPPIHIVVKNGSVVLEGTVKSVADKNLAGARASSVANVSNLKNNLNVRVSQGPAKR